MAAMSPSRMSQPQSMMGTHASNLMGPTQTQNQFLPQGQFPTNTGGLGVALGQTGAAAAVSQVRKCLACEKGGRIIGVWMDKYSAVWHWVLVQFSAGACFHGISMFSLFIQPTVGLTASEQFSVRVWLEDTFVSCSDAGNDCVCVYMKSYVID